MSRVVPVALLLLLVGSAAAHADNTTCAGAIFIVPDGSPHTGQFTPDVGSQARWFRFVAKPDRSYSIEVENLSPTDAPNAFVELDSDHVRLGSCAGPEPPTFNKEGSDPRTIATAGAIGSTRRTYVSGTEADFFFMIVGGPNTSFRVRVKETTLFAAFFTTVGHYETYYHLANTTTSSLDVTLKLFSPLGAVLATYTVTIQGGRSARPVYTGPASAGMGALDIANNTVGYAVIVHNGAPGALAVDSYWGNFVGSGGLAVPVSVRTRQ